MSWWWALANNKISFFAGSGNGSFGSAITTDIPTTLDHRYAEALDLDRDKLDLLSSFAAAPGVLHVFRSKGGGASSIPSLRYRWQLNPVNFSTADMNGDGKKTWRFAGSLALETGCALKVRRNEGTGGLGIVSTVAAGALIS